MNTFLLLEAKIQYKNVSMIYFFLLFYEIIFELMQEVFNPTLLKQESTEIKKLFTFATVFNEV